MHKAKSILLLITALLGLALAACQSATPGAEQDTVYGDLDELDPSGTLVVYWHALTDADEDRMLEMIDDFNATNAWNITVVGEYQGDPETLYDKVIAGLPTDQLPSLVMSDLSVAAAYAAQDVAIELSPYLRSKKWGFTPSELNDFFPSALTSERLPQFQNQSYSLPSCRSLQVLYYNDDWLKELGYDAPPQTWDDFRQVACAASQPTDGLFGFEMGMDSSIFTSLLATQDTPLLNAGATEYTLGGARGRASLQLLQGLISDGCALWETEEGQLADFSAGRILFTIDSTAQLSAYERRVAADANFAWSLAELPHTTDLPLVGVYGSSTAILHNTPEEQLAAWLFVKWLSEPAQQAQWSQEAACYPVRRSAFEEMGTYLEENLQYSLASQLLEHTWIAEPGVTAYATCRAEIGRMLYAVTAGESVDEWLSATLEICNQALTDAVR